MKQTNRTINKKIPSTKFGAGFTLLELLIIIAIIGLLSSIVLVALGSSRARARDSKRLFDLQQMRTGLELYYAEDQGYPEDSAWNNAALSNNQLACNGRGFFVIPDDPQGFSYIYTADGNTTAGCGGTLWSSFEIEFGTEENSVLGPPGTYYLTPFGFNATSALSAAAKSRKTCPPKSNGKGCKKP